MDMNENSQSQNHVHTKIVPAMSGDDDKTPSEDTTESSDKKGKKHPFGNREGVKKYCKKKKARAASLEDEVVRLRALNQQLINLILAYRNSRGFILMLEAQDGDTDFANLVSSWAFTLQPTIRNAPVCTGTATLSKFGFQRNGMYDRPRKLKEMIEMEYMIVQGNLKKGCDQVTRQIRMHDPPNHNLSMENMKVVGVAEAEAYASGIFVEELGVKENSLIKMVYFSTSKEQPIYKMKKSSSRDSNGMSNGRKDGRLINGRLYFIKFETSKINECLDFISSKQHHYRGLESCYLSGNLCDHEAVIYRYQVESCPRSNIKLLSLAACFLLQL
ncbi:basic leucine zipper 23-like protein [Tanacetum coccineum]